jgi:hypothetical protein
MSEPPQTLVAVESMNDGEVSWLAGPFATGDEAEAWMDTFISTTQYDRDFVYLVWPTPPDEVMRAHTE